ncbi:hypothetical protein [Agromyces seonyuensis]|uniref:Uncharacterized protein n=1 Tax=Agromyces seonyuensis TaxID=2662446 RepID=A0A6I4NT36_9MICO|nr:hypothetical protein [Agromyces seonyuensis]MWB97383.1 hypothetical protein [Agromyces seonyuensis]
MTVETYVAEFLDGPLEGEFSQRALIDGEPEERVSVIAAVDGLESIFWYGEVGRRESAGQWRVQYRFDPAASDPVEADDDDLNL